MLGYFCSQMYFHVRWLAHRKSLLLGFPSVPEDEMVEEVIPTLFLFIQVCRKIQLLSMCCQLLRQTPRKLFQPCHSSSMMSLPLLWVMLQLLLLLASVEFTLNCHAEDIIFGNYSFCHNLSVLASDHLGNKRLEMGKLDFARKQPHQCLQCLSITAVYSISMSSSRKANTPSAKLVFLFAFFFSHVNSYMTDLHTKIYGNDMVRKLVTWPCMRLSLFIVFQFRRE